MKKIILYFSFLFIFSSFLLADSFYQTKQSTTSLSGSFVKKSGDIMTGNLNAPNFNATYGITASTGNFNSISLSTFSAIPSYKEGNLYWDNTDKTLALQTGISDTTMQVGQELYLRVRNNTGSIIQNGSAVYITGRVGNRPTIALAVASSSTTAKVCGIATEDIAINDDGFVTILGLVRGINTSAFSANETLYLSSFTAGGYQTSPPPVPNYSIKIGNVATAMVNGSIAVDLGIEETNHTTLNYLTAISSFTSLGNANFENNVSVKYGITASTGVFTSTVTAQNGVFNQVGFDGDINIWNTAGTTTTYITSNGVSYFNGGNLQVGRKIQYTPSATQILYSTSTITSVTSYSLITSTGGAVTLNSNPQITAGDYSGQQLLIRGLSDTNIVTLTTGNGIKLDSAATTFTMGLDDNILLLWNGTVWYEISRKNN